MSELDTKICDVFAGLVVRKDLVKTVKGNAIVPSYVLEYLLGQYCATNDEDSIEETQFAAMRNLEAVPESMEALREVLNDIWVDLCFDCHTLIDYQDEGNLREERQSDLMD